jgi:hypothetical protein
MPFGSTGVVDAIVQVLFQTFCFYTGKLILRVISFGRLTVEDRRGPWWNPFARLPDGRIAVSSSGASVFGFFFWVMLVIVIVARNI